jgi:hypothetical protein
LVEFLRRPARPLALLLAISVTLPLAAGPAAARCAREEDQQAFDIAALQSELMVMGVNTACREEQRYNAFVERYRPQLIQADRTVGEWFKSHYGRAARARQDAFTTELAQLRAFRAQALGSDYCPRNGMMFNEVMALPVQTDLAAYAAGKNLVPAELRVCETPAPAAPARRASTRRAAR